MMYRIKTWWEKYMKNELPFRKWVKGGG